MLKLRKAVKGCCGCLLCISACYCIHFDSFDSFGSSQTNHNGTIRAAVELLQLQHCLLHLCSTASQSAQEFSCDLQRQAHSAPNTSSTLTVVGSLRTHLTNLMAFVMLCSSIHQCTTAILSQRACRQPRADCTQPHQYHETPASLCRSSGSCCNRS
jgi:hypothetical protein